MDERKERKVSRGWLTPEQKDTLSTLAGKVVAVAVVLGICFGMGSLIGAVETAILTGILAVLVMRG